jgi:hypothetical protein
VFNEPFFNAVIKRAGGHRLTDLHTPPPGAQNVDYLLGGFALELKILMSDPLAAPERQARIEKFLRSELPKGPLWVTATKQAISLSGQVSKDYWERIMGKPIQDRLDSASEQIRDTRSFVPGSWKGGVLIVNSAGPSFDWQSFTHLAGHYQERFSEIDAVFAMNALPVSADGKFLLHFAVIAKDGNKPEADVLWKLLDGAIREEIAARTNRTIGSIELDPHISPGKGSFQLTPTGVRKKLSNPAGHWDKQAPIRRHGLVLPSCFAAFSRSPRIADSVRLFNSMCGAKGARRVRLFQAAISPTLQRRINDLHDTYTPI